MRAISAAMLLALIGGAFPVRAADPRADELADVEQRLKDRSADESRLKNEVEAREKEVASLRRQMIETANSLQDSEKRMKEIVDELKRIDTETRDLEATLMTDQESLSDVLAALQSLEMSKPPALLVSPDDANKAARAAILLSDAAPELEARASAMRANLEKLTALREERDRERAAFEKTAEEIASRRSVLAELLKKKQAERDVAASLAAAAQKETAALAARATSLREVIRRLERLATAIAPRLKPPPPKPDQVAPTPSQKPVARPAEPFRPSSPFASARGALKPPVVGQVTGQFGSPRPDGGKFDGLRFSTRDQAIVTAPYEASVAFARPWEPIGNLIVLDVGGGYHILLIGVSTILVQEGQRVTAGEPIGAMSAGPGGAEGSLDLEIRKDSEPVNPSLWLSGKSTKETGF